MTHFERALTALTLILGLLACSLMFTDLAHADQAPIAVKAAAVTTDEDADAAYDACIDQADTTYADCQGV